VKGGTWRGWRGWLLAVLHLALVASLAGKYRVDRHTLPRGWVRTQPYDPELPIRGRYVQLRVETRLDDALRTAEVPQGPSHAYGFWTGPARLAMDRDGLILKRDKSGKQLWIQVSGGRHFLTEPIAYFLPEKVADPSRRPAGEELWVEVSVPRRGPPRPIRLGVRRGGVLTPLDLD
jgi:hypothetical protein